jgi:hypothetical protein
MTAILDASMTSFYAQKTRSAAQIDQANLDQNLSSDQPITKQSPAAVLHISGNLISAAAAPTLFTGGNILTSGDDRIDAVLNRGTPYWWHKTAAPTVNTNTDAASLIMGSAHSLVPTAAGKLQLTYSFLKAAPGVLFGTNHSPGFTQFTASEKAATKAAFAYISSITKLTFKEVASNSGTINFGNNTQTVSQGYAYYPYNGASQKTWLFMKDQAELSNVKRDGTDYNWNTLVHEIGHTLGLKHPGNYNAGGGGTPAPYLDPDTRQYSIMSYYNSAGSGEASSFMPYDVAALQYLYGINRSGSSGNFNFNDSNLTYKKTLWSTSGTKEINLVGLTNASLVNLNAGSYSNINIFGTTNFSTGSSTTGRNNMALAYGSNINKVKLAAATTIHDNVILNAAFRNTKPSFNSIANLTSGDKLGIKESIYTGVTTSANIQIGESNISNSAAHKMIVNTKTGVIYYDADGLGSTYSAKKIAIYSKSKLGDFTFGTSNFNFLA